MRNIIIREVNKIKLEEDNFKSEWWKYNYFAEWNKKSKHISNVKPEELDDEDLVRFFKYIFLCREEVSSIRVDKQYFSK